MRQKNVHISFQFDYTSGGSIREFAMPPPIDLEEFWMRLLSEEPALIHLAWKSLSAEEQRAVRDHLQVMTQAEGWHPTQRKAARTALRCIGKEQDPPKAQKAS
jgi:hypothetical protein